MPVYPDRDQGNADWTKMNGLDWPGATAETVARFLYVNDLPIEWLTSKPMYERWIVIQPWLLDVPKEMKAMEARGRRLAKALANNELPLPPPP